MPSSVEAVVGVLLAIVPGYFTVAVWARARTWRGPAGDLQTVLQSLTASAVVHVLAAPLTIAWLYPHRDRLEQFPERLAAWAALVVLVVPPFLGGVGGWVSNRLSLHSGQPSIWDWFFTKSPPHGRYLAIEFNDGTRVAGVYAEGAVATTSPDRHGIYLKPEWLVDDVGDLVREVPGSGGLLITGTDDIRWVRILDQGDDDGEA